MPAEYPQLATAAGTTISISTTAPATHDAAGFEGITGWIEIGAIVNSGGFPRSVREFNDVNLLDGSTLVIPLNETMENIEVEAVYQENDAGQTALEGVADGLTIAWFRWMTPAGTAIYAAGYVTGYGPSAETSEDYVGVTFTIKPIFDVNKVGPVRVKAA